MKMKASSLSPRYTISASERRCIQIFRGIRFRILKERDGEGLGRQKEQTPSATPILGTMRGEKRERPRWRGAEGWRLHLLLSATVKHAWRRGVKIDDGGVEVAAAAV